LRKDESLSYKTFLLYQIIRFTSIRSKKIFFGLCFQGAMLSERAGGPNINRDVNESSPLRTKLKSTSMWHR